MNNSDKPSVVALPVAQPPMPIRHVIFPKEGQFMLAGELTPATASHKLDTAGMPPSRYQVVRDDVTKLASIPCTRIALLRRDHTYVGIIDSNSTPHVFVLSSEGLALKPALNVEKAWAAFDDMMMLERQAALNARRVRASSDLAHVVDMAKALVGLSLAYSAAKHQHNLKGFHLKHFDKRLSHFTFTAKNQQCPYGGGKECKKHGGDGAKTHKVGYVHANAAFNVKSLDDESDLNDKATTQLHQALRSSKTLTEAKTKLKPLVIKHYGLSAKSHDIEDAIDQALDYFRKKGVLHNGDGGSKAGTGAKVQGKTGASLFCPYGGGKECKKHGGNGAFVHKPGYIHPDQTHATVDLASFHAKVKAAAKQAAASGQKAKDFFNDVAIDHRDLAGRDLELIDGWAGSSDDREAMAIIGAMEHLGIVRKFNEFFTKKVQHGIYGNAPHDHELTVMAVLARYEYTQAVLRKKYPNGFMPMARGVGDHPVIRAKVKAAADDDEWFEADQNPMTSWADVKKVPSSFKYEIVVEKMMPIENVWVSYQADSRGLYGDKEGSNKYAKSEFEHIVISPDCAVTFQKKNVFFGDSTDEHDKVPESKQVSGYVPATVVYPSKGGKTSSASSKESGWTVDEDRPAGGSQGGKWFKDKKGDYWFGKHYDGDTDRVAGEHLTNQLYKVFGIKTPETKTVEVDGETYMMSRDVGGSEGSFTSLPKAKGVMEGFVVDAWLANWDVVGLDADNMRIVEGEAYRVDNGGSLIWRAQGEPKKFDAVVNEINSMREPDKPAGRVFGKLSDATVCGHLKSFVNTYKKNKAQIAKLVAAAPLSATAKKAILKGLKERAEWLTESLPEWEKEVLHAA